MQSCQVTAVLWRNLGTFAEAEVQKHATSHPWRVGSSWHRDLFSYLQQLKHLPPRSAKMPNEGRAFLLTSQSSRQRAVHSVVSELWWTMLNFYIYFYSFVFFPLGRKAPGPLSEILCVDSLELGFAEKSLRSESPSQMIPACSPGAEAVMKEPCYSQKCTVRGFRDTEISVSGWQWGTLWKTNIVLMSLVVACWTDNLDWY